VALAEARPEREGKIAPWEREKGDRRVELAKRGGVAETLGLKGHKKRKKKKEKRPRVAGGRGGNRLTCCSSTKKKKK